jgi:hypothetical protein
MTESPPSQRRKPWTEAMDQRLRELAAEGRSAEEAARQLERTREGVRGRAQVLGVRLTSSRRRWKPWYAPSHDTDRE